MRAANPYNYNLPVRPEMFFGRRGDVENLARHLTITPGDSFALIGGRRMGKTSLLEALLRTLEPQAEEAGQGLLPLPIFLDLTGGGMDSAVAFFRAVAQEAHAALADRLGLSPEEEDLGGPPGPAFRRWLERWGRVTMAQRGCRLRLVLLLDECEQIVEQPWTSDLYGALRYLLIGRTTRSSFKVVMAGSHRFLTQVRQEGSPLRNILTYHRLRVLDEGATHDLITRPPGGILLDEVVPAVAEQSGGHPFLTQYLMHHLWEQGLERATPDTVRRIAAGFPHERGDFQDWADGLEDTGLRVYGVLAQGETPLTEAQVRAALHPGPLDLTQALEALCYHGLVAPTADGTRYRIAGEMFRTWFAANVARRGQPSVPEQLERPPAPVDLTPSPEATQLHHILRTRLNLGEFRTLCFDIGVRYDSLGGETLDGRARELVLLLQRRGALEQLNDWFQENRPDVVIPSGPARGAASYLAPSAPPPGPIRHRWALLVGVDRYLDPAFPPLRFCVNDVLALERVLERLGYTVVALHDDAPEERLVPTRDNVEAELARLCRVAGPHDLLLVHFACHGKLVDGRPVLVTREIRAPTLAKKALPLAEVERQMRASAARRLVLTLDACHTGVEIGRDLADPEFIRNAYELAEGFALIAASTAQQVAQEWEEKEHGVFTYYLLEGLSGQADRGGKEFVTVDDLKTHVLDGLRRWNVEHGGLLQEPTARTEGLGDIILADYRTGG
jgi:hypothetical protein